MLRPPADGHRGALVWRWTGDLLALSSAAVGGGLSRPSWALNIGVPLDYDRTDLAAHAAEVAEAYGLAGGGVALFTAADVTRARRRTCAGVAVDATVGVTKPTWASDPSGGWEPWTAGTINLVVQVPVGLGPGAAVNAVITATEAKAQALRELGVPGTGTASDAIVVVWPAAAPAEAFAGPRSLWGARIAQAAHAAVRSGIEPPGA
ncbi:MAG: adenosylcobinamide amidohydrolase [Acidimicrobiia bacterium]|nr:adenosylcobinamide amidohydrolase [Acidimicrobiia bacterium]